MATPKTPRKRGVGKFARTAEQPECERCHEGYSLRDGDEPTPLCDRCAHVVAAEQALELRLLKRRLASERSRHKATKRQDRELFALAAMEMGQYKGDLEREKKAYNEAAKEVAMLRGELAQKEDSIKALQDANADERAQGESWRAQMVDMEQRALKNALMVEDLREKVQAQEGCRAEFDAYKAGHVTPNLDADAARGRGNVLQLQCEKYEEEGKLLVAQRDKARKDAEGFYQACQAELREVTRLQAEVIGTERVATEAMRARDEAHRAHRTTAAHLEQLQRELVAEKGRTGHLDACWKDCRDMLAETHEELAAVRRELDECAVVNMLYLHNGVRRVSGMRQCLENAVAEYANFPETVRVLLAVKRMLFPPPEQREVR